MLMVSSPGQGGVPDAELPPHRGQADHQGPGHTRAGSRVTVLGRGEGGHTKQKHEKLHIGSFDEMRFA